MAKHEIVSADGRRRWVDDEGHILADGEKLVVSMMARDSMSPMQRSVAEAVQSQPAFDTGGGGGRPGFSFNYDAARAVKEAARNEMIADMVNGWKTPPVADRRRWHRVIERDPEGRERGSSEWEEEDAVPGGQKPGDACTIDGQPGHLNARLQCVPDRQDARPVYDAAEGKRLKDEAYDAYCADLRDGWRTRA